MVDPNADHGFEADWLDIPDPASKVLARGGDPIAAPKQRALTRREVKTRRTAALAGWLVWPLAVLVVWGLRGGVGDIAGFLVAQGALWIALLLAGGRAATAGGPRGVGVSVSRVQEAAIGIPVSFVLIGLLWLPAGSTGELGEIGPLERVGACVGLGTLVAIPLLAIAAWAFRRAFPSASVWRGAALGAASGIAAALVLTLHCGVTLGGHIALAHGGPVMLATLLGAIVGSKVVRA